MRTFLAAVAALALVQTAPANADQILGPGRIDNSNRVILPGGPTLGRWQGNLYTATPDNLVVGQPGSFIPWKRAEAGAVLRDMDAKLREFSVSVKDFGAVMDGATDDTSAFTKAVAALTTRGGGKLIIPEGRIVLSGAVVDTDNVLVQCSYEGGTTILPASATATPIKLGGGTTIRYNLGLDRCYFEQAPGVSAQTAGNFVSINGVNKSVLSHFRMAGGFSPIQIIGSSVINYVDYGEIYNTATAGSLILIDAVNDQLISNLAADNPVGSQPSSGIRIVSSAGVWLRDIDLIHSGNGLLINPGTGKAVKWVFGSNVAFDSGLVGVNIVPSGTGIVYGVQLTGLWTSANTQYGANIAGGDTIEFFGQRAISNGMDGVIITAPAKNIAIRGGSSCGNSVSAGQTYSGINVGSGVTHLLVHGTRIGDCVGTGTNMLRGIVLQPSTSTNYVQILDNDLSGNSGQALSDNVTTSGADIRVERNIGVNPVGTVGKTIAASPMTYTAGRGRETLNLTGGTVSLVTIQGAQVCTSSPCSFSLPPNRSAVITYSAVPTLASTAD